MSDNSKIEWTDATWNPLRFRNRKTGRVGWFCEHVTEACRFCYAESFNLRLGNGLEFKPGNLEKLELFLDEDMLRLPLKWKRPRKIFVCSMTDLFGRFIPDDLIDRMFSVMAVASRHTFQILTKRPERARQYIAASNRTLHIAQAGCDLGGLWWGGFLKPWPLPNVWFGTSIANQEDADKFIPELLATPAATRFVSAEPLLGPINLRRISTHGGWYDALAGWRDVKQSPTPEGILDLVICGGESGAHARPMHPDWPRRLRDQCAAAGVAFFFKQWGEWAFEGQVDAESNRLVWHHDAESFQKIGKKLAGRLLDGVEHSEFPKAAA